LAATIKITRLPGSLGRLVRLEKLLLSRNKLEVLPPQVGWLRNLKLLHLMDNKLTRLPPQVRLSLTSILMRITDRISAEITEWLHYMFVLQVGHCDRLEQLYMEDNPIKDPPRHVFKLELTELLLYLSVRSASPTSLSCIHPLARSRIGRSSAVRVMYTQHRT
jgi:Leucine-rich repeat (LRR) protein